MTLFEEIRRSRWVAWATLTALVLALVVFSAPNSRAATTPLLHILDKSVVEGQSGSKTVFVKILLSKRSSRRVKVSYTTVNGTAQAPSDFVAETGVVSFPAGVTSKRVGITVLGDTLDEVNETFKIKLSSPVRVRIADGTAKVTITNDDDPSVSVADVSHPEGTSGTTTATVDLTLSHASLEAVTVDWATADGSAFAGPDYSMGSGTAAILAGETSTSVDVEVVADYADEADENFNVVLSNPTHATLADGTGQTTIVDDDLPCQTPDPPSSGLFLGSMPGDTGAFQFHRLDSIDPCGDVDYYSFEMTEQSDSVVYLSAKIVVQFTQNDSPSSGDIDLCVYGGSASGPFLCSTTSASTGAEVLCVRNDDDWGSTDDTNIVIKVDGFGNAVNNYTLDVYGNVDTSSCNTLLYDP